MTLRDALRVLLMALTGLASSAALSGCVVAGWSSTGGGFVWPGGLGVVLLILLVFFLLRRRR